MIELNKDLRNYIKYHLKAMNKSRKEIANEIGISVHYLDAMTQKRTVSANGVIKVLKYLKYPDIDRLKLEEKKIYKNCEDYIHNREFTECINSYNLSLSETARILGIARQNIHRIVNKKFYLTKKTLTSMISKIQKAMEDRND